MNKKYFYIGLLLTLPLQSCIDSDYNLSDLDTNVTVPVNNLTLPLNMESLTLHTVLDLDENSQVKEHNGQYAVVMEGTFESEPIQVDNFNMNGADIENIVGKSTKSTGNARARVKKTKSGELERLVAQYTLPTEKTNVSISGKDVTEAIQSLKSVNVSTSISTKVNIDKEKKLNNVVKSMRVENFSFKVPKGLEGTLVLKTKDGKQYTTDKIDSKTGVAEFEAEEIVMPDGEFEMEFNVSSLNEDILEQTLDQIKENDNFSVEDNFGVNDGAIGIYDSDFKDQYKDKTDEEKYNALPDELDYVSEQEMTDISVEDFSGNLDYAVEDVNIEPIDLSDVPDLLNQTGTYLNFTNPQLYLSLNNPVADGAEQTVPASTKFEITSVDKDGKENKYPLDKGEEIVANAADNYFYLSPKTVENADKYESFEQAEHVKFSTLGQILSGGDEATSLGIPTQLVVKAIDTRVKADNIQNFKLGQEFAPISGRYVFYAPLSLTPGSRIRYQEEYDGWNTEELDNITISALKVSCDVTTDVPFALEVKMTPIDKFGKRLTNCTATGKVVSKAQQQKLELVMTGEIKNLDGIVIDACATAESDDTLTPNMNINMENIKASVSGKYQSEL